MKDFDGLLDYEKWQSLWLLLSSLDSASDAVDPTLFYSRIDGLLDPFWRSE